MAKRELASDVPLPERAEITPNSVPSTGKKLRKENSEKNPVFFLSEQHKITPRMDLELENEGAVTEPFKVRSESSQSNWSSSQKNVHGVQIVSQSRKLLYTKLVKCREEIYEGKCSSTCKIKLNGAKIDKKEDEVNVNQKAILQKHNNVNSSIESSCEMHRPNTSFLLPFEKVSPIWKLLEALNVFNHIPQMPHFRKLDESKCEEEREGRAIGMMVTYANLAESIHRLQMHTKVTDFEAKIACLFSLEENGFVVDPIRSHMQELLALKTNDAKSALKRTELETALANKEQKNMNSRAAANGYEAELVDVRKKLEEFRKIIAELEKKEKAIMKGKASVLISTFEGEHIVSRLREEISSLECSHELNLKEFERIRSRPLTKYLM